MKSDLSFAPHPLKQGSSRILRVGAAGLGLWFALNLGGCSVTLSEDAALNSTTNSCESSGECSGGSCIDGICQALSTELPAVLLEVTPPALNSTIAGITFTTVIDRFEGGAQNAEVKLGHVSEIAGAVRGPELSEATCLRNLPAAQESTAPIASDKSLPARLTLTPRARILGLSTQPITSAVETASFLGTGETSYGISLKAPPGRYDLYVEPKATEDGCIRPPYLVLDQLIDSGDVSVNIELPEAEILGVTVRYPHPTDDLQSWTLDIVERTSGRLLSSRANLGEPVMTEEGVEYSVSLAFSQVKGLEGARASELVRLSPPKDVVAPIIYVERSVVDLFQDGAGLIDQLTELPKPVNFSGRVALRASTAGVPSKVTLFATELGSTSPGTLAAFTRTAETKDDGFFEIDLLPGVYTVIAEPFDPKLSRVQAGLTVSDSSGTQMGKTIEVYPRSDVSGTVFSFSGVPVAGAPLWASPAYQAGSVLSPAMGEIALAPAALGMTTDNNGDFVLLADPGTFHLAARPDHMSGFAWRILLGVEVKGDMSVGTMRLPLPLAVRGTLTSQDTGTVVPDALMRVYALLKDGKPIAVAEEADQVVAVGESRADSEGQFRLLLPAAL